MAMKDIDATARLKSRVKAAGSQRQLARDFGVHETYISALVNGRVPFSDDMLDKLGLRRAVVEVTK